MAIYINNNNVQIRYSTNGCVCHFYDSHCFARPRKRDQDLILTKLMLFDEEQADGYFTVNPCIPNRTGHGHEH